MTADFLVVLDACVLAPAPLRDTLLRLAEYPRLYLPRWSDDIITEMVRTLEDRFGIAPHKTAYLVNELRKHFGEAWVTGYAPLIGSMTNDTKDRHVVAAAVRCGAEMIVTYNKRHFPAAALDPWGIEAIGPSTFLGFQYDLHPAAVVDKLHAQARNLGRSLPQQLKVLRVAVPTFVDVVVQDLGIQTDD